MAAQNETAGHLSSLDSAADDLRTRLANPAIGACAPNDARPGTKAEIEQAVRTAIETAGKRRAVLVLAFLGHGFTTDQDSHLYYMAADSRVASPASGVDVARLVTEAAGEPGVAGIILLIDTCHAAGGVPDVHRITGGAGGGRTQVAVLFASTADQPAYGMQLTTSLNVVLRDGIAGVGPRLHLDHDLVTRLRDRIVGQAVGSLNYDANPYAMGELWLARNTAHQAETVTDVVGPTGQEQLRTTVSVWRPDYAFPERWSESALNELAEYLAGASTPAEQMVLRQVRTILDCVHTAAVLTDISGSSLTTESLRTAARLSKIEPNRTLSGTALLRDLLERAALRQTRIRGHRLEAVVRFVAALAIVTSNGEADPGLRAWAADRQMTTELNDAFAVLAAARQVANTRLVVSLANALTGWPEQVEAWLRQGQQLPDYHRETCERPDRPGVEAAIGAVIRWAHGRLTGVETLEHIDVVAPAHLLASWYPEEADIGAYLLGVHHLVTPRWSGRLGPSPAYGDINHAARTILVRMAAAERTPVDWITAAELADPGTLKRRLKTGGFGGAIGVNHVPDDLPDVLDLLLPHSPVLLWPRQDSRGAPLSATADQHWHTWPDGLLLAYRHRLSDGTTDPESCLRTVWHDEQWLEFCHWFETRNFGPLEEKP
ncbi:hypothetical protein [Amycolatopsis coloradensis]|uniref:vWA-MoxR associated conflict system protein n=1 Tax=Amycolatopsis coloradensis TaxID=76021 RepID=UPI001177754E|nr:hypothetical protein [Amycolatopsis coloradensis]